MFEKLIKILTSAVNAVASFIKQQPWIAAGATAFVLLLVFG